MKKRIARWLAWTLAVLYVLLTASGQLLQVLAGRPWDPVLGFSGNAILSAAMTVWSIIGALIVSRQPGNRIGWILCAVPLTAATEDLSFGYAAYDLSAHPGSLPGVEIMVVWTAISSLPFVIVLLMFLFLLFPDGRLLSPRWRLVAWLGIGAVAVAIPLLALRPGPLEFYPFFTNPIGVERSIWIILDPLRDLAVALAMLSLLAAAMSLILRLYRARGDARQQVKWLAYTAAFFPLGLLFFLFEPTRATLITAWALQSVTIVGLPIAAAIAIFKYRLYDIDLIINKTLVYGALTGALALVYFMSVVLLQQVFPAQSPISIVLSTLAVAALFSPLRRRLQNAIDKRFYRRKYDAQQTLAAFSVHMRDEVELEQLSHTLLAVVDETMHPTHVSLWLKEAD
jgi:hypothetical protein